MHIVEDLIYWLMLAWLTTFGVVGGIAAARMVDEALKDAVERRKLRASENVGLSVEELERLYSLGEKD